jgi:flagellar hook-associated protein 1 FlgK
VFTLRIIIVSLFGALQIGNTGLATSQLGIQVTGNNISNSGTTGYTRQTLNLQESGPEQIGPDQFLGTGVNVASIDRNSDDALNASLRNANSDQSSSSTLANYLSQIQTTFGTLNDNDLSSQVNNFFNGFSTLANNPSDAGQRSVVIQNGQSLAQNVQTLRSQLSDIRDTAQNQLQQLTTQANGLFQSIASLNKQIASSGNGNSNNTLLDQRDQDLSTLSTLVNVQAVPQANGQVNILIGSIPVVQGTVARPIGTVQGTNAAGTEPVTNVVFTDNGDPVNITGGQIGATISARDNSIDPAINSLDTFAAGLIQTVNSIYSQGQGLTGYSNVTATNAVTDPNAALNAATASTGLAFPPTNGTFTINETDQTTGQVTSRQITVNLSGNGTPTTLNSLAASITGGNITATVDSSGHLTINSTNSNSTFSFSNDSSGVLASLGINTYFTGSNAQNIGVNQNLVTTPSLLATGRNNIAGSNNNAQAVALGNTAANAVLGGKNLQDYYTNFVGDLANKTKAATDSTTADGTVYQALFAQQQSTSGVSMNEETVNLMTYQQAFQGSAHYINVINQMMQDVLSMVQ